MYIILMFIFQGGAKVGNDESNAFAGRSLKKGNSNEPISLNDVFKSPFSKGNHKKADSIGNLYTYIYIYVRVFLFFNFVLIIPK